MIGFGFSFKITMSEGLLLNDLHYPTCQKPSSNLLFCSYYIVGNFCQEKISSISPLLSLAKILPANFLSCVNNHIQDMANFTALVKICSTEYFCNTEVAGLVKFLSSENFRLDGIIRQLLYNLWCNSSKIQGLSEGIMYRLYHVGTDTE